MTSQDPSATDQQPPSEVSPVFRPSGVSYLHIPALDARQSAGFYRAVFGWDLHDNSNAPGFEDGTGHVIGHFMTDLPIAGEAGVRPYIYVNSVEETLAKITAQGCDIVDAPYPEGNLIVATFHDPAGNVIGVWQLSRR